MSPSTTASAPARRAGPTPATDFAAAFERLAAARASEPDWLRTARAEAFARFQSTGLPTRKSERWRYTNLADFAKQNFDLSAPDGPATVPAEAIEARALPEAAVRLVFVDGVYSAALSSKPPELPLRVDPLSLVLHETREDLQRLMTELQGDADRPFLDLNLAFCSDGALVRIAPDVALDGPIHLLSLQSGGGGTCAAFPRIVVVVERGARATLVEEHAMLGVDCGASESYLDAPVTQVHVREGARLEHVRLQTAGASAHRFASVDVALERDAAWSGVSLQLGAHVAREELRGTYRGTGGDLAFSSLALADGRRTVDVQVDVVHEAQHCRSRQTYRGVADDHARAVFDSRVAVERDAQGTDSGQSSKSLLLSEDAIADTKPQLEVLADDVKCFHGATVGQLDEAALFFLRSRGIAAPDARALLTRAFASEVVDALPLSSLRERMEAVLQERLLGAAQ